MQNGIYIVGDKSWSIDMQRYNFQFTGQRFYKITDGKLDGQLRDVAYQATTTDFWGSMEAVGGPQTYVLGGALNCGKAQPAQSGAVSHGCPSALFRERPHSQHHAGGRPVTTAIQLTPQDTIERGLALAAAEGADGCVVIVAETSSANLRWANNTLTTNGAMRGSQRDRDRHGRSRRGYGGRSGRPLVGHGRSRYARSSPPQSRPPAHLARPRTPDRSSTALPAPDWDAEPEETSVNVYETFAPALGETLKRASKESRWLYGFADHEVLTLYVGSSAGLRLRQALPRGHSSPRPASPVT